MARLDSKSIKGTAMQDKWDMSKKYKLSFWDKITDFVSSDKIDSSYFEEEENLRIAIAALLVHTAEIDGHFHRREFEDIENILSSLFKIDKDETDHIILQARKVEHEAVDLHVFVRVINRNLDNEQRETVVKDIWRIILSDGVIDNVEDNLIRKICSLMGISSVDCIHIRDEVIEEMDEE